MDRDVLALDVGASAIKAIAGRMDNGSLTVTASSIVPTEGYAKGVYTDYDALAESVREAIRCLHTISVVSSGAFIGIGGTAISSTNSKGCVAPASSRQIIQDDMERVRQAAIFSKVNDALQVLHFIPNCYWVDGIETQPVGKQGSKLEVAVHIVTYPEKQIKILTEVLTKRGIKIKEFVSSAIAGAEKMAACSKEANILMMDIGAGSADIVLYQEGHIVNSASLPFGGYYITQDIMQGLEVNYLHAEEIKRYYGRLDCSLSGQNVMLDCNDFGTKDKQVSYDFLANVIESRIEEIVSLLYEYLVSFLADAQVDKILLTGGCACMPTFRQKVQEKFHLKAELYQPDLPEYVNPIYTACVGILSYAAEKTSRVVREEEPHETGLLAMIKKLF